MVFTSADGRPVWLRDDSITAIMPHLTDPATKCYVYTNAEEPYVILNTFEDTLKALFPEPQIFMEPIKK